MVREGVSMLVTFEERPAKKSKTESIKVTSRKLKSTLGMAFLTHILFLLARTMIDTNKMFITMLKISTMCIPILPVRKLRFPRS